MVVLGAGLCALLPPAAGAAAPPGPGTGSAAAHAAGRTAAHAATGPATTRTDTARTAAHAGARTPFTTIEAESGKLGGDARVHALKPGDPPPTKATPEAEASGYAYARLDRTGQSVSLVNRTGKPANTLVVRASIPDAPDGGGIDASLSLYVNGKYRQSLTISSKQAWNYRGATTNADDPHAGGMPYRFYNEFPVWVKGAPLAPGSTLTFKKGAADKAAFYDVDSVDLEHVGAPRARPRGALSVVARGADPHFRKDSTLAIQKTVDAARASGRPVWIPPGRYLTNSFAGAEPLDFSGVTVRGAGMWYTTIYRRPPLPATQRTKILVGSHTRLSDIQIDSNAIYRDIAGPGGADYGINASGADGWLVERIWNRHTDANWLSGTGGLLRDSRSSDSYGDGFNINNGGVPHPDRRGDDITVENSFARNSGDDGFAVYSDSGADGDNPVLSGARMLHNTAIAPWWANGMRIAGGRDIQCRDNLVRGSASNDALVIGVFGDSGHPLESATVSGNVLIGGRGWNGDRHGVEIQSPGPTSRFPDAYTNVTLTDNMIKGSLRAGLIITKSRSHVRLHGNTIDGPAGPGILIAPGATGTGSFSRNAIVHLRPGQPALRDEAEDTFTLTG
ncbi:glycosyl hydrolase family 28-related protein [Streptomyces sp. SPB074]|uniref:glycosyl hydrolase family 28-related protein n=1 Tax=Streptomyces sp. (strain SPB074) TaxID=465543 RepID=UPI000D0A986C|nr:glycosyl hydrolase family 28-related protein [Streptomyces sp. SPB074]